MSKQYFVYILTNYTNTVLYIGVTSNITKRLYEHQSEVNEGFTKKYHVHKLVYLESFLSPTDAIAAEKKLKGWTRKKKNDLISKSNPEW